MLLNKLVINFSIGSTFFELLNSSSGNEIQRLAASNMLLVVTICFISGILTSFTPCVYPMIPITISIFSRAAKNKGNMDLSTFFLALIYVAGMSTTYSFMGLIAGITGSLFGSILQNPFVLFGIIILFVALGLAQLGVFSIALPSSVQTKLSSIGSSQNRLGIFIMGVISGLIISPCVGPVVAGILAFIFETSNALKGFLYFFSFSLGLGMLFLFLGAFSGLIKKLPKSGPWLKAVNLIIALFLFSGALYYSSILYNNFFKKITTQELQWFFDENLAYQEAKKTKKPILIDFTADWCLVCHEIDKKLLNSSNTLLKNFVLLKIDVTQSNEKNKKTLKKYGVSGLPAIVFIDRNGNILKTPRIQRALSLNEFISIISQVSQF